MRTVGIIYPKAVNDNQIKNLGRSDMGAVADAEPRTSTAEESAAKKSELFKLTKPQLIEMAAEANIDISSCNTKEDIIAAIEAVCSEE